LVKEKIKERYGDNIPLDEVVVSPAAIFESDKLFTVNQNYMNGHTLSVCTGNSISNEVIVPHWSRPHPF
jgi:hypothetical protein